MTITCDVNFSNLHFLLEQNKVELQKKDGFSFYFYRGQTPNRNGWLITQEITSQNLDFLKNYITVLLTIDSAPVFVLMDEDQKDLLQKCMTENFADFNISFDSDDGDSDYIYSVEKMAKLPGKKFQKKRNHISRFKRTFGENWCFHFYAGGEKDVNQEGAKDFLHIQEIYKEWKKNKIPDEDGFLLAEEKSLEIAVRDFEKLELIAGTLYVKNEPVAFLIASFTTENCLNVHFEKSLEEYAEFGALTILNQQFAEQISKNFPDCIYLNREEDLNMEGLRKSKLSYQPEFLIRKYYGKLLKREENGNY